MANDDSMPPKLPTGSHNSKSTAPGDKRGAWSQTRTSVNDLRCVTTCRYNSRSAIGENMDETVDITGWNRRWWWELDSNQ